MSNFGVITEQGYPMGQFGFNPISEEAKKKLEKENKKNEDKKDKEDKNAE